MVDQIGTVGNVGVNNIRFKGVENNQAISNPITANSEKPEVNASSLDAIGNYNQAVLNMKKNFVFQPVLPTIIDSDNIDKLRGEKIYSSDGKLNSIIDETDAYKTIYKISSDNDNMIESVRTVDKNTGKDVKFQYNTIENGKYQTMVVREFDSQTGEPKYESYYEDGKLADAEKIIKDENGNTTQYCKNIKNNSYEIYKEDKNGKHGQMTLSGDGRLINIHMMQEKGNMTYSNHVDMLDGKPYSFDEKREINGMSDVGQEPSQDKDLTPAIKIDKVALENEVKAKAQEEGIEKTNYSNGALESVTYQNEEGEEVNVIFDPEGNLYKYTAGNKEVVFQGEEQDITEKLDDAITKKTSYYDSGYSHVEYKNGDNFKHVSFDDKNKLSSYDESKTAADGKVLSTTMFYENGKLSAVFTK